MIKNILVLMCDQLRYDALGCNGNPYVSTPNLDRLAARSVRFTRAYSNSPVCGPTRHSLATGLYPYRHGVVNNYLLPLDGMYTIAHHLSAHGLRTACFGHMHWQRMETGDGRENVFPDHGFDLYGAVKHDTSGLTGQQQSRRMWERVAAHATAGASAVDEEHSYARQTADASIAKLREWAARGERFLSWTSFNDPHPPFFPPPGIYAKYAAMDLPPPLIRPPGASPSQAETGSHPVWRNMTALDHRVMKAGYYGLIELADRQIGRVLDALDELNLSRDTAVLFTVDHGEMLGDFGLYMKSVMWEAAVHMPFFIHHPDAKPREVSALAGHVDVFPTLCDLAGVPVPDRIQGRSLAPWLSGSPNSGDRREYAMAQLETELMARFDKWKIVFENGEPARLFDLESDPHEFHNRLIERPDIAAPMIQRIKRDHPDWLARTRAILASGRARKKKLKPKVVLAEVP